MQDIKVRIFPPAQNSCKLQNNLNSVLILYMKRNVHYVTISRTAIKEQYTCVRKVM